MILAAFLLAFAVSASKQPKTPPVEPLCKIVATPKVGIAPIRYIRLRVTVEPREEWREASITLYDADGVDIRHSQIWEQKEQRAPRIVQIDWPHLALLPGEHTLVLTVRTSIENLGCQASDRIVVVASGESDGINR